MADITMCFNPSYCKRKKECYRSTATPDEVQSYSNFYEKGKVCKFFLAEPEKEIDKLVANELKSINSKTKKKVKMNLYTCNCCGLLWWSETLENDEVCPNCESSSLDYCLS
jgi:rubrerythrin